MMQLDQ